MRDKWKYLKYHSNEDYKENKDGPLLSLYSLIEIFEMGELKIVD